MNPFWQQHLAAQGARIADGRVSDFGDAAGEIRAAGGGTVLADLSHLELIAFSGDDTRGFLHGQLSCDVHRLGPEAAEYGSYCTAKGRMLAVFLLWQREGTLFMQLPAEIRAAVQKRLAMFVLRSRVKVEDASGAWVRLGLAGSGAADVLEEALGALPAAASPGAEMLPVSHSDAGTVIRLGADRFQVVASPERAPALWDNFAQNARPVGGPAWNWLEIRAGVPVVLAKTQEQFVPQMANLELLGGVSFNKGCYPGQEIVARTRYLGKLKRRMYLAHVSGDTAPAPGDELYSADMEGQASGMIVTSAPSPEGGYDVLAVIQMSSAEAHAIHWKSPQGAGLQLLPLPYSTQVGA
ncbi:MAG: folate-binding protein YgfZ [Betaproteobacteria bacterium]|nr:folate-binding protein YgfZ [Betaproteobacteria bacterium]